MSAGSTALERLDSVLARKDRLVVAFSGGVDSGLLAQRATVLLGAERVLAVTADSPSLARDEHADCTALAAEWGLRHRFVPTGELDDPAYARNDVDRCYFCKSALMDVLVPLASTESAEIVLGVNLDDLGDLRPGQRAAAEAGAVFPLVEAGLDKAAVRQVAAELGLRIADKPAAACLASRLPHGTVVTLGRLAQVETAESTLRRLGFNQLRVRHHGDTARIELALDELGMALAKRDEIVSALRAAGYRYVTLDLEGFRSGNLARAAAEIGAVR